MYLVKKTHCLCCCLIYCILQQSVGIIRYEACTKVQEVTGWHKKKHYFAFSSHYTYLLPRNRNDGQVLVRRPGHGAAFSPRLVHLSPQRRTVRGDLPDGYDLLPVQRYEGVEFLHSLEKKRHRRNERKERPE